ncbi:hypothetical protein KTO58_24615 [Chitinophaga pendula]|uniref:hypothetical protein n=1 Tax=Chitinophaga TaxID=79328 RepID=UPI000BAF75B9|nr:MULTISPECIES: hypothetical protein [Chitinophaga]ASZ10227.1 hypothetical protein CK934_04150 [Chitinophaga sp. MD30]UCJ06814.1 hypothetical protein KTO58_24615 [Chitinophaga pendula]
MDQQYDVYKDYSNVVLLKIVLDARRYPADAVQAARTILAERRISPEEEQQARVELNMPLAGQAPAATTLHATPAAGSWLTTLYIILGVYYAISLYGSVSQIIFWVGTSGLASSFYLFNILTFLSLIYMPVTYYLVLQRQRLGWMLAIAELVFFLVYSIWNLSSLFNSSVLGADFGFWRTFLPLTSFHLIMKIVLVVLLLQPAITNTYGVAKEHKIRSILIALGALCLFGIISLLYAFLQTI